MSFNEIKQVPLLGHIKNQITRSRHPKSRRMPTFYPSSASVKMSNGIIEGGCWTADFYRISGVTPTNTSEFYISMIHKLGKAVENVVVEAMMQAGIYESSGVKFYSPELNVSGELDICGRYKINDVIKYYGVEVKSVYGIGATETITGRSRAYKGQPAFRPKPKTGNILQVMTYLDQFSEDKGADFALSAFKLVYLPRDKPNDGREYTICLLTSENLPAGLNAFKTAMKPGEKYAVISTDGYPDYVETRFSLSDMYARWAEQLKMMEGKIFPPRPYQKFYDAEKVEELYALGEIAESTYQDFKAGKATPGHYLCQSYCEYRDFCWTRGGSPRKEASLNFVEIEEPKAKTKAKVEVSVPTDVDSEDLDEC